MGREDGANKNKGSKASAGKAEKVAARRAAKAKADEELWAEPAAAESEEGAETGVAIQAEGLAEESEVYDGDPFELIEQFDVDSARELDVKMFGKTLFGGLDKASKKEVANETDRSGDSLLHVAVRFGAHVLIPTLLSNGADINHRNKKGMTALADALEIGSELASTALLADKGLDPKAYDKSGASLLFRACRSLLFTAAAQLIENGADVQRADRQKNTPLHGLCTGCAEADKDDLVRVRSASVHSPPPLSTLPRRPLRLIVSVNGRWITGAGERGDGSESVDPDEGGCQRAEL